MNRYQFRNQLKAQGNRLNQKNVNELLLVPKKEPGMFFFKPLASERELMEKFNVKSILKNILKEICSRIHFEILSQRNLFIKLRTLIYLFT